MSKVRMFGKIAVACGALGLMLPAGNVTAEAYPPSPSYTLDSDYSFGLVKVVDPNPVPAGSTFEVTIRPCTRGQVIPITFQGTTVNAVCTNPHAKAEFRSPSKAGTYEVVSRVGKITLTRSVNVTGVSAAGSDMPNTGSSGVSMLLSLGATILLTGGFAYVVAQRRRPLAV